MNKIKILGKTFTIVTLDFETYYDDEYTLSKSMNMSEYVRDERFKAHGVGIRINGKGRWYTGKNIKLALNDIDWSNSALLCHNTPFDGFILSHHYNIVPGFILETLAMARAIHGQHRGLSLGNLSRLHGRKGKQRAGALVDTKGKRKLTKKESDSLGLYCLDDCWETDELFTDFYDHFPDDELELVHYTTRMFTDPVLVLDEEAIREDLDNELGAKTAAVLLSGATPAQITGNQSFADLLSAAGVKPPTKISPTTGKTVFAFAKTDLDFKKLASHSNEKVRALYSARLKLKSTIGETRALRFLEAGKNNMPLPVMLLYAGAHTLRWSGGNKLNLQNLKRGGALRRAIYAPEGWCLGVGDSAQIEARILAWLAKQTDIILAFANKKDVYKLMASSIYSKPESQISKDERFIGKVCVLGLGFGMGAPRLQDTLAKGALGGPPVFVSIEEAETMVRVYRTANSQIKEFWKTLDGVIRCMAAGIPGELGPIKYGKDFIRLPNGLFLHYPQIHYDDTSQGYIYKGRHGFRKIYGGMLAENVTQAIARCVMAEQWVATERLGHRVVLSTHDELVICRPESSIEKDHAQLLDTLRQPPAWATGLPLDADGGWARNYSK